jgi:hypothetical protein
MVVLPMLTTSSMGIVLLQLKGQFVTQVPLLNFQTFASDKVKDLVEVSEVNTRRWKFHTCDVSTLACEDDIETWASWLIHRDLRAIDNEIELHNAFHTARIVQDVSFQDALRDAFLARLREGQHSGSLNVDLLQLNEFMICWEFPETSACIIDVSGDLLYNLILHHDAKAATVGGPFGMNDEGYYKSDIREQIPDLALAYFTGPKSERRDPLQLSDDEFCRKYHAHNKENQPCYRTHRLPGTA